MIVTIHGETAGSASFVNWISSKALLQQPDELLQTTATSDSRIPMKYSSSYFLHASIDHEPKKSAI
jgi:hypothetical protein